MRVLQMINQTLKRLELTVAILAMTGVVAMLSAQVLFRYVIQSPLFYAEEVALVLLIVATFSGLSILVAEDRLIGIDLLGPVLSAKGHAWVAWAMRAVVAVLAGYLAYYAILYVSTPWVWNERFATVPLPRAALYSVVTAELCLTVFHQIVRLLETLPGIKNEVAL